ncbi:MAG: GlsB/YeaQ/YmgE family stress response membrane protein [Planctomycetota bacterium]
MPSLELSAAAQQWVNLALVWIGLGALAGIVARIVLPVKRPASPAGVLFLGICGSTAGLWSFSLTSGWKSFNPISPLGFLASVAGAFVVLLLYQLVAIVLFRSSRSAG